MHFPRPSESFMTTYGRVAALPNISTFSTAAFGPQLNQQMPEVEPVECDSTATYQSFLEAHPVGHANGTWVVEQ